METPVAAGADVNTTDLWGERCLETACRTGDRDLVRWLITRGANVTVSVIFGAMAYLDASMLRQMLQESGINPNERRTFRYDHDTICSEDSDFPSTNPH